MSREETAVVFVQCLYTDVAKPQLAISVESEPLSPANYHRPRPFCSSAATLARFHVEIL